MAALMLTDLSDETYRALKRRASKHGRSLESEIQDILDAAVAPKAAENIGSVLAAVGKGFGGIDLDIKRDTMPVRAADFE